MLELGELVLGTQYLQAQRVRSFIRAEVRRVFEASDLDALVAPTLPRTTVPLAELSGELGTDSSGAALAGYIHHVIVANVTGLPALSIPCGFSSSELPIGLEFLGRPFEEHTLFAVGRAYEEIRPGYSRAIPHSAI
jgi:aspartyl-tRNA(Asn)/glutamyl-tRNA(Gln) amidotransferase subunit A